jgi:hypothetical protein
LISFFPLFISPFISQIFHGCTICPHRLGTLKQWSTTQVVALAAVIANLRITLSSRCGPVWASGPETDLNFPPVPLKRRPLRFTRSLFIILPVDETSKEDYFCSWTDNIYLRRGWNYLKYLIPSPALHRSFVEISSIELENQLKGRRWVDANPGLLSAVNEGFLSVAEGNLWNSWRAVDGRWLLYRDSVTRSGQLTRIVDHSAFGI